VLLSYCWVKNQLFVPKMLLRIELGFGVVGGVKGISRIDIDIWITSKALKPDAEVLIGVRDSIVVADKAPVPDSIESYAAWVRSQVYRTVGDFGTNRDVSVASRGHEDGVIACGAEAIASLEELADIAIFPSRSKDQCL